MSLDKIIKLESVLDKTNDWLKFAEAKNGAVLAFNGAVLFALSRLVSTANFASNWLHIYLMFVSFLLLVSIVIALSSFVPRLEAPYWIKYPELPSKFNLIFYGHICSLSAKKYLELFNDAEGKNKTEGKLAEDIANQIVINSKISYIKYEQFRIAVWFTLSALLTPIGAYFLANSKQ